MRWLLSLFSFFGRARRRDYVLYVLVSIVAYGLFVPLATVAAINAYPHDTREFFADQKIAVPKLIDQIIALPPAPLHWTFSIACVAMMLLFIVWIAISVRRFHDMGVTGWLFVLVAVFNVLVFVFGYFITSLIMAIVPGTRGRNVYGRDPRGREPAIVGVFEGGPAPHRLPR